MKLLDFPNLRQTYKYDCGATTAQAVLAYYGIDTRAGKLIKKNKTNDSEGTQVQNLIQTLESFGISCEQKEMTPKELREAIDNETPVIVLLQAWPKKAVVWENWWHDGHYVCAIGYDKKGIIFEDPYVFYRTHITDEELLTRWHHKMSNKTYRTFGIIVRGQKNYNSTKIIQG